MTREDAYKILTKYNKEHFHIQHAITVEKVMMWFADKLGYGDEKEHWGIVGMLHDVDFEMYPKEHCVKARELLKSEGVDDSIIHSVISHGYGMTMECGVPITEEPTHEMEKVLFASDELTGLIWSASLMRPSKSTKDMELKSLKKKYKDKKFAAGCSRDVIEKGATMLGWDLDKLLELTLTAMKDTEDEITSELSAITA